MHKAKLSGTNYIYIYRVGDDANAYDFIDLIWLGVGGEPREENVVRFIGFKRWV